MRLSKREAEGLDYAKSAQQDTIALQALAQKLYECIADGHSGVSELSVLSEDIIEIALDLNDLVTRIKVLGHKDIIPEGSRKTLGLSARAGVGQALNKARELAERRNKAEDHDDRGTCKECGAVSHLQQGKCLTCFEDSTNASIGQVGLKKQAASFDNWIDTFISEKGIDLEQTFDVEGPDWGTNTFPYGVIIEHMKIAPPAEQAKIKNMIVKLDFANADIKDYLRHLGKALAR